MTRPTPVAGDEVTWIAQRNEPGGPAARWFGLERRWVGGRISSDRREGNWAVFSQHSFVSPVSITKSFGRSMHTIQFLKDVTILPKLCGVATECLTRRYIHMELISSILQSFTATCHWSHPCEKARN